jgi:hypothetical protein
MAMIDVDEDTYQKLAVSARLMERSLGDVVRLLVQRLVSDEPDRPSTYHSEEEPMGNVTVTGAGWLPVYKTYKTHRVEGAFNPATMELRISTAPWNGQVFPSPTRAAKAVVERLGGDNRMTSNTNGRKFWHVKGGEGDLRTIVGTRF